MSYTAWRLTKAKHASSAFSGYGSVLHAGRWHRKGVPLVYTAESPALALLETLVHVENAKRLDFDYVVVPIRLEEEHLIEHEAADLLAEWRAWPWPAATQALGTHWFEERESVALSVPSVVVPRQRNYLINPLHPQFDELEVNRAEPFPIDVRLARR